MGNVNENKIKNKILIAIIILLLLSNVCFIGFIIYGKANNKKDDKQQDEAKENNEEDDNVENPKTNLEASETKKLYILKI